MATASNREIRRHILRLVAGTPDGEQFSRVLFQQLIDLRWAIIWPEFDRHLVYLERAGCVDLRFLHAAVDRSRIVRILQRGLEILEGSQADPGIMPPAEI